MGDLQTLVGFINFEIKIVSPTVFIKTFNKLLIFDIFKKID